ncbi:hypothetical protein VPH35_035802 [Triticum aestivum]
MRPRNPAVARPLPRRPSVAQPPTISGTPSLAVSPACHDRRGGAPSLRQPLLQSGTPASSHVDPSLSGESLSNLPFSFFFLSLISVFSREGSHHMEHNQKRPALEARRLRRLRQPLCRPRAPPPRSVRPAARSAAKTTILPVVHHLEVPYPGQRGLLPQTRF